MAVILKEPLTIRERKNFIADIFYPDKEWEKWTFHRSKGHFYLNTKYISGKQLKKLQKMFLIVEMEGQDMDWGNICIEMVRKK